MLLVALLMAILAAVSYIAGTFATLSSLERLAPSAYDTYTEALKQARRREREVEE